MKTIPMTAMLVLALVAASASAADVPERVKKAGKLVIATQPNYPPIAFKDPASAQLTGFDIELGEALAKELGVKAEWQETAFAQLFSSIQTQRVDVAMVGVGDFPSRRETVDFVNYLRTGAVFYTLTAQASSLKTPVDLCGKRVGASRSTSWPKQIEEWSKANCEATGKAAVTVIGTEGSADTRTQLKSGRLDAGAQGNETMPYFQKLEPNTYVLIGTPFTEALVGVPVSKTEPQLRDAVKDALQRLQTNGTYDKLLAKYGLEVNKWSPVTVNQGK
jgi:polar amino acid transport system substrate-binding protein